MTQHAGLLVIDWPSILWALVLAGLTGTALSIKSRYPAIARAGAPARVLAHVVIGYFGLGMTSFGAWCAVQARFPVPGGAAWTGPVAIVGGLAAATIGTCTLVEHVVRVARLRPVESTVTATTDP
jgi:hypothetical protein